MASIESIAGTTQMCQSAANIVITITFNDLDNIYPNKLNYH